MIKEEFKKAILIGVVTGITIAITLFALIIGYLEIEKQYREHKHRKESINRKSYGVTNYKTYIIDSSNLH